MGEGVTSGEPGLCRGSWVTLCVSAAPDPANAPRDPPPARSAALPPRPRPGGTRSPGDCPGRSRRALRPGPPAGRLLPTPAPTPEPPLPEELRPLPTLGPLSSCRCQPASPRPALAAAGTPRQVCAFPCLLLVSRS